MSAGHLRGASNPIWEIIGTRKLQVTGVTVIGAAALRVTAGAGVVRAVLPYTTVGGTIGLAAYFLATFHPRTRYPGVPLIDHLPDSNGSGDIGLTFDDGPFPETTPLLLDTLRQAGARATFFLVGERAAAHSEMVRRIAAEGHSIGVHGLRHHSMVLSSARRVRADLGEARRTIEDCLGAPLPALLLRPPYGFRTWALSRTAARAGWTTVAWSFDPRDYDPVTPETLAATVVRGVQPGDIVLLHERPEPHATLTALPRILQGWTSRGLRSVAL